ncbi:titin [Trichonephila inaurata madagascariensis]|uniref:Titin n=1 Tax=Trichonephila inaurata madagascariensis TaxID=2747483 RepID=A0A8X6K0Q3_9ARAC|nr:titin [Trichonephila inaurata madagascariensis]
MKTNIYYLFAVTMINAIPAEATLNEPPKIQRVQVPSMVEIGEKVNIPCLIKKGSPPFQFEWLKNSVVLRNSENTEIVESKDSSRLTINPVTDKSSGNYTCVVHTKHGSDRMTIYISVKAPPIWSSEPKDVEAIEGEITKIPCSAEGSPAPRISWKRLDNAKVFMDFKITSNNGTLMFSPVNKSHESSYVCEAYNDIGLPLKKIVSLIVHEAPVIQPFSLPEKIQIGKSLSLTCAVTSGTPPLDFKWYKNQNLLSTGNIKTLNKIGSSLMIDPITENSGGNYSCVVSNSKGRDHFSVVLVVTAPPVWVSEPEDVEIIENQNLNLKCLASGSPNPVINWRKIGKSQRKDIPVYQNLESRNGSLLLVPTLKVHEGNYMCIADNGAGPLLKKMITLTVKDFPKIQPFQFPQYIQIGYKTSVMCTVMQGVSPLSFVWYKNGRALKETATVNIESNENLSTLRFDPVEDISVGNYTCVVSNPYGKDNHTAYLSVRDEIEMKYFHHNINGSLVFKPVQKSHEGKYSCEADNGVGNSIKKTISVIVYDAPKIQPFQFPPQIKRGDTASITCSLMRGSQPIKFTWIKDNKPIENRQTVNIISNEDLSGLIIKSIDENSVGNYTCIASNSIGSDNFTVKLRVKVPPSWIKEPQDVETVEGQKASFTCFASGSPSPRIEWRKLGNKNNQMPKSYREVDNGTLTFNPASKDDDGSYECKVENGIGEVLTKIVLLVVHDSKDKIQPFIFPQKIREGESAKVMCAVNAEDKAFSFKWFKNGAHLKNTNRVEISSVSDYTLLKIKSVSSQDSGNYTCVASSSLNTLNYTSELLVEAPVQWVFEPTDEEVILGENVKFLCSARGFPTPIVTWSKILGEQEYQVDTSSRFRVDIDGTFTITNVQSDDGATYVCHARNGLKGFANLTFTLDMFYVTVIFMVSWIPAYSHDAPEIVPFHLSAKLKIGDNANILCSVIRGQVPLSFKWYKNGKLLKNLSKEANSNEKFSTLVIDPVTATSAGNYTCVVSNSYGKSSYSTMLIVRSPPHWLKEPEDAETIEGSSVSLFCNAGGTPQPRITWKKIGEKQNIYYSKFVTGSDANTNGTLSIYPVLKEHEGIYICEVNNDVGETLKKQASVIVHDVPKIVPFHFPSMVEIHEKASVACILKQGRTPLEFKWIKDNQELYETKNIKIKSLEDVSIITIEPVTSKDSGNYTCVVANSSGKDTHTAVLLVEAPSRWIMEPLDVEVMEGDSASLICKAEGQPSPRYTWKKSEDEFISILSNVKEGNLTFQRVTTENAGRYICEVENGVGEGLRKTANLIIHGHSPNIQPFSVSDVFNEGESAKMGCVIRKGDGPFIFKWFRDNAEIKNDSQFEINNSKDVSFLTVKSVTAYSSGNYTCEARNSAGKDSYSVSLVVNASPKWITEPNSVEGLAGSFVKLDCQVSGYPPPVITWTKQNDDESMQNTLNMAKNGSLIFSRLLADHEGEYLCKAQNNVGSTLKKLVTVTVLGIPQIQPFSFPNRFSEGSSAKALCNIVHGKRPIEFHWLKNGKSLKGTKNMEILTQNDYSMLTISDVKSKDAGNYTCNVKNSVGIASHTAYLIVEAPPFWVQTPYDLTGVYGSRVFMECAAAGSPKPRVTWYKGNDVIRSDSERVVAHGNGTLHINILNEEDEGLYRCTAHNGVGDGVSKEIKIVVNVPARFDEKFTVVTVKKGDSASLRCEAIGDQPLSVIWRKDSKELRKINGGRYEIFETLTPKGLKSELVLREADRTDGQLYTCLTENPYGKDERSIKLLVMEVPATPLDLKVQEVWSRSASVSWSSPYTGNSPITKYVLQYWRDAVSGGRHRLQEKIVSSAQTSALIKDLHPGTNYGLAIVAENTVGRGEPSDTVSFTTGEEEPSGPPMDVNVDVKGTASLLVTWKPPSKSDWNGKLKGYYVGYKIMHDSSHPYSFKTVEYVPGGVQEHMITSLRKDTEYSIIVKAFNTAGSGVPSQDVIVRTLGGDLPSPPIVFVVATSENSIKIQWRSSDTKSQLSGHAIYYRKKGEGWQRVAVTSPHENSYTLTGLHAGAFYQLYVTANSDFGEGDPSDVVTVKTYAETNNVVLMSGEKEPQLAMDMSLLIPVAASALAVTLVIVVVCIWVLKAKSRRDLERAIQEDKRYIYAAASQRYVDIDKTRSLPAYHDPALIHFPQPYATVLMGDDGSEGGDPNEMKSFLPQNMKDRPLPKPGTLKKQRDSHIYDSPQ